MATWLRRAIIRLHIRRRSQQPQVYRFQADRWQMFRIYCAAAQMQFQQLDSIALTYSRQPTLLVVRSEVEGVTWWKVNSAAPSIATSPELPVRSLRPFEITDDLQWSQASKPAIVVSNPTSRDAKIEVFYAVREEDGSGGQLDF